MQITWLGHSAFRIVLADQIILIDPWLQGNPACPPDVGAAALAGVTAIFLTHAHGDHASDAPRIAGLTGAPVFAVHELAEYLEQVQTVQATGMGRGGTVTLGDVRVAMVPASHSSSIDWQGAPAIPAGDATGFMITGEGRTIYVAGDTAITADMDWMGALYRPDIGILPVGGHYTMDIAQAAWAARRYFDFKVVIPCHYGTFDLLAQDAAPLRDGLPGVDVRLPQVGRPMDL